MVKAVRTFRVTPSLPPQLAPLTELAGNFRWVWDPGTREIFEWADRTLWQEVGGNPTAFLGRLSAARLAELSTDTAFLSRVDAVRKDLQSYLTGSRWAQSQDPAPPAVAYFSAEFGITEVMQVYSGGLGVLAGDHLKAASDLGLPLVGIGLLYRHGYFRQLLDADGWQREQYPDLNPYDLPLTRLEDEAGSRLLVEVELAGRTVAAQIWKADVGRVPLLLLDTDIDVNHPDDRQVTDRLYGGDAEHRLRQEIVLGIGGVRALEVARQAGAVTIDPVVFHANEGHAGFLQFERILRLMRDGLDFDQAIETARASVLFTTHTPVPAGIDRFDRGLMEAYFSGFAEQAGVSIEQVLKLGQEPGDDGLGVYNMAMMGLRLSAGANGVSKLHGQVSRGMFADLWPGVEPDEVPITSITNGVHASTWTGEEMTAVYDRVLSPDWSHNPEAWKLTHNITDDQIWRARGRARERLVTTARTWARQQAERRGESSSTLAWTESILDPDALTIGFARRFATYKRATLLLSQPDRLRAMLASTERPIQFIFSGKAHPKDDGGKGLIREIMKFSNEEGIRDRVLFVEDYDMAIARTMLAGCDVWLNNPRRPHEASGTSGEKSVLNGGLHASVLDGWWDEMYVPAGNLTPPNGFAIGSRTHHPDPDQQDAADAAALFDLLERIIIPTFYDRSDGPLPRRWLACVRASLTTNGPKVLASRMVQDYATELYTPVAIRAERLTADGGKRALELAAWRGHLATHWSDVSIDKVELDHRAGALGDTREVAVDVTLGSVAPEDVEVQIVHGPLNADGTIQSATVQSLKGGNGRYSGVMDLDTSGEYGLTARVVPRHEDLRSWADTGLVTWAP
ncbi:alpha-glucan family phosphorylase [Euzebya tangerina]|uniref:alpha-glucan family phosphorylase n=1 Tax=Euzebya tangerina TaxID=591198 RepID=UPI000E30F98F|nr:alpha-glucan family phosphorylase [Euzebya tangerina]